MPPKKDSLRQKLNILLIRNGDERRLLYGWRIKNDFYSTVPGNKTHRSYHKDGRVHTKVEDWGDTGSKYYTDISFTAAPGNTSGVLVIQGLMTRAEISHHQSESEFEKFLKLPKAGENFLRLNANQILENSLIAVAICACTQRDKIDEYLMSIKEAGLLKILGFETAPEDQGSIFFAVAFAANDGDFSTGCMHAFGWNHRPLVPLPGTHSVVNGANQTFTVPFTKEWNPGPPPQPIHRNPPVLPWEPKSWMKKYSCKIVVSRLSHIWVEIGPLTICAIYKKGMTGQQIILAALTKMVLSEDLRVINNSNDVSTLRSKAYEQIEFQFGLYRGHTVKQFSCGNLKFQMEIKGARRLGSTAKDQVSEEYDIELIEMTESSKLGSE